MLDVVENNLDGLVLKSAPKADTLEASLDAYTKPNLFKLAELNDFDVKQSWNKAQMIEVISNGLRDTIDERLKSFEGEELATLQEVLDGNLEQAETASEVMASAVSKGLLYVSADQEDVVATMPVEFKEKFAELTADAEPVEEKEEPTTETVRPEARKLPAGFRRRRRKPVVKQRIVGKKIGRNEPCPCGSGKKYKKCCWIKDRQAKSTSEQGV